MDIESIIKGAVAVQKTMQGINAAYEDAPSSISQFPAFVNYPGSGDLQWPRKPMEQQMTHEINMDLLVQEGGNLAGADRLLKPYLSSVYKTFNQNITLGGSCLTSGVVSYKYGHIDYAGNQYLGIKFVLRAIELSQVVYKA